MDDGGRDFPDASHGPRSSERNGANPWLTRTPRPSLADAPWERTRIPDPDPDTGTRGNHTDGVSVAELIARMDSEGGGRARAPRHSAAEDDKQDAVTTRIPVVAESEIPDLAAAARRRRTEALLRGHIDGKEPEHIVRPKAVDKKRRTRHRPAMLAGRVAVSLLSVVALLMTGAGWHWSTS